MDTEVKLSTTDEDVMKQMQEFAEKYNKEHNGPCPACGRCPSCGRNPQAVPWNQWPYPYYEPYRITWANTDTVYLNGGVQRVG